MRRLSLHIAIAIIAFVVGVTAAAIFGASFMPRARNSSRVYMGPRSEWRGHGCRHAPRAPQVLGELPALPEPPAMPEPPPPPAALKPSKSVRVIVRRPDGSVRVIESQTEQNVERQFQ
ncbi:MAG TPA: hypothetical protein VM934_10490 [Pyrinomonadaceae bacterium]|jgi:hypothetical protein|nr:hypothetical protein [Pyrinomonadaceae bacterium]